MIQEYAALHNASLKPGWRNIVTEAFSAVDTDMDGELSMKEVQDALETHGYPDLDHLLAWANRSLTTTETNVRYYPGDPKNHLAGILVIILYNIQFTQ